MIPPDLLTLAHTAHTSQISWSCAAVGNDTHTQLCCTFSWMHYPPLWICLERSGFQAHEELNREVRSAILHPSRAPLSLSLTYKAGAYCSMQQVGNVLTLNDWWRCGGGHQRIANYCQTRKCFPQHDTINSQVTLLWATLHSVTSRCGCLCRITLHYSGSFSLNVPWMVLKWKKTAQRNFCPLNCDITTLRKPFWNSLEISC